MFIIDSTIPLIIYPSLSVLTSDMIKETLEKVRQSTTIQSAASSMIACYETNMLEPRGTLNALL